MADKRPPVERLAEKKNCDSAQRLINVLKKRAELKNVGVAQ